MNKIFENLWESRKSSLRYRLNAKGPMDPNVVFSNRDVEEILSMRKVGIKISFEKAWELSIKESIYLGNFDSAINIASWAQKNGFFIEFEENELTF